MARKLIVEVVADPSLFKRGMSESATAAGQFEAKIKGTASSVRSHLMLMSGGLLAAGGVVAGLKSAVGAAESYSAALKSTDLAVKSTGGSVAAYRAKLDALASSGAKLGFTNTEVLTGLKTLTLVTGNATDATKYMGLAEDIARAKGVSLQAAATAIGKAIDGKTTSLQRYGIVAAKGETVQQLLTEAMKRYAGQAVSNTTVTERLHATLTNLESKIGAVLLPTFDKLATSFENWIGNASNARKVTDDVKAALGGLGTVIHDVVAAFDKVWPEIQKVKNALGSWVPIIALVGAALVKLELLSPWTALAVGAVYVMTHWQKVRGFFETLGQEIRNAFQYAWVVIESDAVKAALKVVEPFSHLPGVLGKWARDAKDSMQLQLDKLHRPNMDWSAAAAQAGASAGVAWADAFNAHRATIYQVGTKAPAGYTPGSYGSQPSTRTNPGGFTAPPSKIQHYTQAQMAQLWIQAGGDPAYAQRMAQVGYAGESSGNVRATGKPNTDGTVDKGLWQINSSHGFGNTSYDPMKNAKQAVGLFNSAMRSGTPLYKVWTDPVAQQIFGGGSSMLPVSYGGGGGGSGKTKKAPAYKIPDALEAQIRAAQQKFTDGATQSHLDILDRLYKQEVKDLKAHGQDAKAQSVANEIAKAGATFQKVLAAAHLKIAQSTIAKIEAGATGPEQILKLGQAAGLPVAAILADQNGLMVAYQGEATQLKAKLAASTGKAKTAYAAALTKIKGSITSTQDSIVSSLQQIAQTAQASLQGVISQIETAADQALGAQYSQGGIQTPSEALLAQMQSADTAKALQDALTQALTAGDPAAIEAAQRAITENDLAVQATKERAAADAAYASAQWNLNSQIESLSANVSNGAGAQDALNKLLGQFGVSLGGLSDPGGTGLLTQLQTAVAATTGAFQNLNAYMTNPAGGTTQATGGGTGAGTGTGGGTGGGGRGGPRIGFASGGMVPGALGQPMLAVVHGGERVQTPAQQQGGGAGVTIVNNFPNYVGSKQELAQMLRSELVKIVRRGGTLFGGFA